MSGADRAPRKPLQRDAGLPHPRRQIGGRQARRARQWSSAPSAGTCRAAGWLPPPPASGLRGSARTAGLGGGSAGPWRPSFESRPLRRASVSHEHPQRVHRERRQRSGHIARDDREPGWAMARRRAAVCVGAIATRHRPAAATRSSSAPMAAHPPAAARARSHPAPLHPSAPRTRAGDPGAGWPMSLDPRREIAGDGHEDVFSFARRAEAREQPGPRRRIGLDGARPAGGWVSRQDAPDLRERIPHRDVGDGGREVVVGRNPHIERKLPKRKCQLPKDLHRTNWVELAATYTPSTLGVARRRCCAEYHLQASFGELSRRGRLFLRRRRSWLFWEFSQFLFQRLLVFPAHDPWPRIDRVQQPRAIRGSRPASPRRLERDRDAAGLRASRSLPTSTAAVWLPSITRAIRIHVV